MDVRNDLVDEGDMAVAQELYDECLKLARAGGDRKAIADALYNDSVPRCSTRATFQAASA